jgi:mannose/fructose/N-acetylgalactosamine-specific phosphotransferase system component IID
MKKVIIGSIVGALIIFIWQFLSFGAINFHKPAQDYTEKQGEIMTYLNGLNLKEGGYIMPNMPEGATMDDHEKLMKESNGKPWASLQYHSKNESTTNDMIMNMVRGFLVNIVILLLFCWLVRKMNATAFSTVVLSALVVGLIVFFNGPYTGHIWYKTFDIWASFIDAIVSWGLTGLWLGWWLRRGTSLRPSPSKM